MIVAASVIVGVTPTMRAGAAGESGSVRQLERILPTKVIGASSIPGADNATPPMIVDTKNHLGFAIGTDPADTLTKLVMYDLKGLRVLDAIPIGTAVPEDIYAFVIDPDAQRLIDAGPFFSLGNPQNFVCREQFGTLLARYDYGSGKLDDDLVQMPCSGAYGFVASSGSLYKTKSSTKLLLTGTYTPEGPRNADPSLGLAENDGQAILIRQLDVAKMYGATTWQQSLDWEIDLRYAGCGRREVFFARRVDDSVLSYCSDPRPGPARLAIGEQGYVVRIPLGPDDRPLTETIPSAQNPADPSAPLGGGSSPAVPNPTDPLQQPDQTKLTNPAYQQQYLASPTFDQFIANPVIRRTPALPGQVFPFVDPSTGNVLLLTANTFNGNAVWVFDPRAERFVGLITGGFVSQSDTQTAAGFDPVRGRAYLLTAGGVLAASTRQHPLPPGKIWPVARSHINAQGESVPNTVDFRDLAIDPGLQRIFVPVTDVGYVVLEDDVVDPKDVKPLDPDTLTRQIDEEPGVTDVDKSGAALASGARILVTGGVPRVVDQVDPFCLSPSPAFDRFAFERAAFGNCLADQFVTKGNRDVSLASTKISTGTATGATAEASGLFVPPTERATSADIENAGGCFERTFIGLSGGGANGEDFEGYRQFCGGMQGGLYQATKDDLRNGTRGGEYGVDEDDGDGTPDNDPAPGKGFPVPAAACDDFGGHPRTVGEPTTQPKSAAFNATVTCHAADVTAAATASGSALAIPGPVYPLISVARTESEIVSHPSDSGQVTESSAVASGVRIGPLQIAKVESKATSIGKGRSGTAKALHSRVWCGISLSGVVVEEGCVDPMSPDVQRLIDQVNQGLGKVRVTVPAVDASATPGGYQAVITKAEEVQAADRAVNDDDSITVPGLQVTVYNDGGQGRSRTILQLANVESESRYAIVLLPAFEIPEFLPELALSDDPIVEALALAQADPARFETLAAIPASFTDAAPSSPTIFGRIAPAPMQALADIFGWLRNNLREALLLFLFFAILALPAYLFLRRRAFERAMTGP